MKFTDLRDDSTAICAKYENGVISCFYLDSYTKIPYKIHINCLPVRSCFFSFISGGLIKCASTSLNRLDSLLDTNASGLYTLTDETKILKAVRYGAVVALGLRACDVHYLASIHMKGINACFISTPVKDENDIKIEIISEQAWNEMEFFWNPSIRRP